MPPRKLKQTLVIIALLFASAGLSYLGSALAAGDDIFNTDPKPDNFRGLVPDSYFQSRRIRALDWDLVQAMPRITAVTEAYGVAYAGNTGSEKYQRLIFQFVVDQEAWDPAGLAAIMDATLKELFADIPSKAWAYQVIEPDVGKIHLGIDGKWTEVK
jgi:hypothetical protein